MKKIQRIIAGKAGARPIASILNPDRPYTPSHQTNVAETWARARAQSEQPTIILPFKARA